MSRLKLKWRIFSYLLGFCVLLIGILWVFQTVLLTSMYEFVRSEELRQAVALVRQRINDPDLQTILSGLESEKEILVMPTQDFSAPRRPGQNENRPPDSRPRPASITQTEIFTLHDGQTISLTFFAFISPVEATVSTLQLQLYLITAIMILLAVVIAIIMAKRFSKPIEDLSSSAKALAAGYLNTHFDGKGFLEIKELSDTLNMTAAELSKTESLRRELMANVSHDLRTPLALIYSYAEMMHDFPDEITREQTQTIMDETRRLTSLVNDVLDVSQLESGTITLTKSVYNLTESINAAITRTAALVKNDGYSLRFDYSEDVYVNADENKITQAFYNLLINAIHYSGSDKAVTIRQREMEGSVRIEVIDTGEGIAPEDLPYIWDRYYKVDKRHKRAVAGTGLGLSIVKKIVALHNGLYGVEPSADRGSIFWFSIEMINS